LVENLKMQRTPWASHLWRHVCDFNFQFWLEVSA